MRELDVSYRNVSHLTSWRPSRLTWDTLRRYVARSGAFSVLALQLLSLWPIVPWAVRRSFDGSDEPLGILALVTVVGVLVMRLSHGTPHGRLREAGTLGPVLSVIYAASLLFLPLPVASLIGLLALALTASRAIEGTTLDWGLLGLLWLSVPLLGSFDFYLGYPLRWLTTELATSMLHLSGYDVTRRGVSLLFAGREVSVDPACAGLRMLWMTAYFVSLLGCLRPLRRARMFLFAGLALGLLVVANAWRAAALFFVESGLVRVPAWGHEAVGAVVLLALLVALAGLHGRLKTGRPASTHVARATPSVAPSQWLAATALIGTFVPAPHRQQISSGQEPRWPSVYQGERLVRESMPPELSGFYRDFPGNVAFFHSEHRRYVFRRVTQPTRRLHPAEHCYRGAGYQVEPAQICGMSSGERFGCFIASRGNERVLVRERIEDASGRRFTDVSSWYWSAWLGRSEAPWMSVTLVERQAP